MEADTTSHSGAPARRAASAGGPSQQRQEIAAVGLVAHRPQGVDAWPRRGRRHRSLRSPRPHRRRCPRGRACGPTLAAAMMAHDVRHGGDLRRRLPLLLRGVDRRRALRCRHGRDPGPARPARRRPHSRCALRPWSHCTPAGGGGHGGDGRRPDAGLPGAGPRRSAPPARHRHLPRGGHPRPPGRRPVRCGGVLAELVRLLRRRGLSQSPTRVPPRPPRRGEGGDRHHAPRRRRASLHPGARRGGGPARRRHHGRALDLRLRSAAGW